VTQLRSNGSNPKISTVPGRATLQNDTLTPEKLQSAVDRIVANMASPARVILFGSQARGDAGKDSDLDLMVIERDLPNKAAEYLRLKAAIGRVGVGVDLLLYSEAEFERRSQVPGTVPYWAKKEGKVLYDAAA
jgi:predicted nucleotidyltransferase